MDAIVVADKQTSVATQNAWGNITLNDPGVVQMPVAPDQVANVTRRGQDLVVTLKSGEQVTVGNFFAVDQAGVGSDMVFVGEDGTLWHAGYDANAFTGFTFEEVASLDQLVAGIGVAGSATSTFAIAGLSLLGAGGIAAAADNNSGSSSSGGSEPGDTTPPATPIDLLVSPDGLRVTGRGEIGSTVSIRDAAGNLIGTGTVGADGTFDVSLDSPQTNGGNLGVTLTDSAGNTSTAGSVTAPVVDSSDTTPPDPVSDLVIASSGLQLSGRGEAGATVTVRNANGDLIGTGVVGNDGTFTIDLNPAAGPGEQLSLVQTDASGNASSAVSIDVPQAAAPESPTDVAISADGTTVTGNAQPFFRVFVRNFRGQVIGSAQVEADGTFTITLDPPHTDGELLEVVVTGSDGVSSEPTEVTAPDITAPDTPSELTLNASGTTLTGRGEAGTTVEVRDSNGNVIATGTVGPDGTFALTLDPPAADGSALQVVLTDAAGNASQPGQVTYQDLQAPAQPTDLALADGTTLTGRGEPGATVQVRDANGTVIGTAVVGPNGDFSLTLTPAQANGETLDVRLTDAAGNTSSPFEFVAPDTTPPADVSDIAVGNSGQLLSGRGEAGATVEVRDANGDVIGTGVVSASGTFIISLAPSVQTGAQLSVTQTDPSGNASGSVPFVVPALTAPDSPTELVVNANGTSLSGIATPNYLIEVHDANGALLGVTVAGPDGTFTLVLNPPQANGELLEVTATDLNGESSLPALVTAPDITPPLAPNELAVSADGSVVTGRAEPGSTVRVLAADGTELGSVVVGASGAFGIPLSPPLVDGEQLQVTATDAAGNASTAGNVTAPDLGAVDNTPPQPASDLAISADGNTVSGRGEAGATVTVLNDQGQVLGTGTVQPDGSFTLQLNAPVVDGSSLQVTLTDAAGNVSTASPLTAPDLVAPQQPTGLNLSEGVTLTGNAEAGARVEVRDADGNLIGSVIAEPDGTFSLTLSPAQANGESLAIRVIDAAGNSSPPLSFIAPDITPPELVTDIVVGDGSLVLAGHGEAGATVQVRDLDGNVIGSGIVAANGTFLINLDAAVAAGDILRLVQIDPAGNPSPTLSIIVSATPVPESPSNLVVAADGASITGSAPVGSLVEVRDANGNVLGSIQAGSDGTFSIPLNPAQANGELLDVVAIDTDGNSSLPTPVTAPDITPPNEASDLQLSADGLTLSGRGEPGATVQVTAADGTVLGNAQVEANGTFTVTLNAAQTDGQVLDVVLRDAAGNTSTATLTAPDLDGPLQPSALAIDAAGLHLTGQGQAGSIVTVRAGDGTVLGTATVNANGQFDVTLNTPQRNGESLTVDATDNLGNSAGPVNFTAPDSTPPQAVGNPVLDASGTTLSGSGEPGATVTVRGPDGAVLGTAQVTPGGTFEVTLDTAQTNGQALTVEQQDASGNVSTSTGVRAPDIEAPGIPGNLSLSADGAWLIGTGEPNTQVRVFIVGGMVLGTTVVEADGSFRVPLDPPQLNGQTLSVTQMDTTGNVSPAGTITANDLEGPLPANSMELTANGTLLNGQGEPNATVIVRDTAGIILGVSVVNGDGTFTVSLNPAQTNGETISVVLIDVAGNASPSAPFTADDTSGPVAATGLQVSADGTTLQGTGEVGATVEVRTANGTLLGTVVIPAGGSFMVALTPPQLDGQVLDVTLTDTAGNLSTTAQATAPDITAPAQPTDLAVTPDGLALTGNAPGAASVSVTDPNGNVTTVAVNPDGSFSVPLAPALLNGETLTVVVTDAAGNSSAPSSVDALDTTRPLQAENLTVNADGTIVGGNAEPGSTVIVRDASNTIIGNATVRPDGTFTVDVSPALASGETATVVVRDPTGNLSDPVTVSGPDGTEVATPASLAISADGFVLTGVGTVGSLITVTSSGTTLGTATVGSDGTFRVFFSTAQLNAQTLQVSARLDAGGRPSIPASIVANDTTAPDAPNQLNLDRSGTTLTGHGEVGATVRVVDAQGTLLGSGTVGSNGLFTVTLVPPQANGQNLTITQADAAGNTSLAATLQAADLQAPDAATGLGLNSAATVVSGQGEAGAIVTVRDVTGAILATGTVNQSGQFQITLPNAQTTGSPLLITLTDAAGNVSGPASLLTPDRTPPAAVTNTLLSADGRQLSGIGEVGATVQVRNAAGTVVGTAIVGADGRFTVTFDTPQATGQALGVSQVDAAGNTSPAISLLTSDLTAPAALTNVVLNNNGLTLTGLGEAGATVTVRGPDGTIIGTGLVAANGSFTLTLNSAQLNAQLLSVTQTDAGNNTSVAVSVTAPDLTPPAAPTALSLAATGLQLSGSAEAGSTVTVRDASGNVLGTAVAGSNGTFQLTLSVAQTNGQNLQVTATDAAGNVSPAATLTAADTTPPAAVTNLAVAADGTTLTGTGEAGATVTVRALDGTALGTATVGVDGRFSVTLSPAALAGEVLSVVQADTALNASPALTITAPGNLAPDIPGNLVLSADGLTVTGSTSPGSTVNVYGPNGVLLGTAAANNDGTFSVSLANAQANGETLQVSAVGSDGSASLPATLLAPDTTAPLPLTGLVLSADGLTLTGHGEPGATVTITGTGGAELGTAVVDANGNFSVTLGAAQLNGELLGASQSDAAGNESNSVSLTAPDRIAPNAAANLAFASGGSLLNGTGEAGSIVKVLAADGTLLGTGVVMGDGTFQILLTSPQANGQQVQVVLTDAAGNQSGASPITAPDTTPPAAPGSLAISSDGITLTGRGEPGAVVSVRNPAGDEIGTAVVDAAGHFTVTLTPALGNAELLSLTQTDSAGNVSTVATLQTPDFTPPAQLTNVVINADGSVVSGQGEVGATVTVTNAAGVVLGTTLVQADGSFRVELTPAQINLQVLAVQQADPPGNISLPVSVTAPDLTPPDAATGLHLNAAGDQLSGTGEAGTTVRVYLGTVEIGTATVAANGTFVVNLGTPQLNGQLLQVTLEDTSNNLSTVATITAADTTPPATVIAALNGSGTQLIGTGEAGARITVMNNLGNMVGQGTIDPDGNFVLDLTTAQINGEVLTVVAQDATGNPSAPLQLTASDLTPPATPTILTLTGNGTLLSGTAEVGSVITVRGPDNSLLGTVTVPAGGEFVVVLSPAQINGQLLTVIATDAALNASLPASYQTVDNSPPDPVTDLAINTGYDTLTGRGEPGATVEVYLGNDLIGTGVVSAAGTFSIALAPTPGADAILTVFQTDAAGNDSLDTTFTTPLTPPSAPPTNVILAADGVTLTGNAAATSTIRVYDANGNLLATGLAGIGGTFTVTLPSAQLNGQQLSVTSDPLLGDESQPVFVVAADTTPPANPVVTSLSANGLVLSGTGEAGANVTVRDAGGNVLGTAVVNAGGAFSINLASAQLNGQVLSLTQTDAALNVSGATSYTAPDTQAPAAPTNLAINAAGTVLTGTGEPGATVTVQGPSGQVGTAVVQSNGSFSITLTTAQNDGQALVVRQTDAAGNPSGSTGITAPDTTPPAAPVASINANGTTVSGSGQVGATVTVRNSAGTVLGTATVGSNGLFVVSLAAAQVDFQTLNVTLTDAAGNTSTATTLSAPDLTPPAAASNLVISADGSTLTGTGEAGATVTVRNASGTVLQTATVQPNGTFTVTLSPAQDNGQVLSVSLTDPRNNTSGNVNITAPDVDANAPVIASDNLATATVNLAPVVATQTYNDSFSTLLSGFSKTYTWTVAAGTTVDPTLTLTTNSVLALLNNSTFTLQVKNAAGAWVTIATGNTQGLLDLIILPLGIQVDMGTLQAGDYRLTVASGGIGLVTTVTTTLDIVATSLTQFTGTGTPVSGNVISDPGTDGTTDSRGPDSAAVLQVFKDGSYVAAGSATTVQGLYGTLVIRADGSYTYTPNGTPSSVGKVDVFNYQLVHANGLTDTATLYVRIDSPQATEIWSNTNLGAPATVVDAVNDIDSTGITLVNRESTSSATLGTLSLPVIGARNATYTTTVAADTTADLQVVVNSTNLLTLLGNTTIALYKLNTTTGQYVLVQSVPGSSLLTLLGGGAAYTFQDQTAGSYQIRVSSSGIGLLSSITTSLNTTTTHLNDFVVSSYTPVTGNLITDTSGGSADNLGSTLTVLSVLVAANTYAIPGHNGVSVAGTYGTLVVQADGSYTYTLNSGLTSAVIGQHDTFTYELTHPNGTTDTATLTINLENAASFTTFTSLLADTGDDSLTVAAASASTEVIAGTDGNDHLDGSQGGHITLQGGAGDDTLVVVDQDFTSVEGGTGTDTLLWGGGDASIDLGNLVGRVHDIEIIDLNDTSAVSLTLNLADVVAITETGNNTLLIKGNDQDSVHMTDTWTQAGTQVADGIDYTQYTAQEDPSHHLWVQNGIHVV